MVRFIGTAQKGNGAILYFNQVKEHETQLHAVQSVDGFEFHDKSTQVELVDSSGKKQSQNDIVSLRIAAQESSWVMLYKSRFGNLKDCYVARSSDMYHWNNKQKLVNLHEVSCLVPHYTHNNQYVTYTGEQTISVGFSTDFINWTVQKTPVLSPRPGMFDESDLEVGNAYRIDDHILLLYYVKKKIVHTPENPPKQSLLERLFSFGKKKGQEQSSIRYFVGAALFDASDPTRVIWRSDEPVWEHAEQFHHEKLSPLGSTIVNDQLILYWLVGETNVFAVGCMIPDTHVCLKDKPFSVLFKKHGHNPIIAPNPKNAWESRATFNSAAVYEDGKVHFIYRALGETDLSVLGYATSKDGITIDERFDDPIYIPREPFETPGQHAFSTLAEHFVSGGGYGGVEDPRITKIDDTFYMTYVAFDGANPPRVALTSIEVEDFLQKRFDKWEKPKLISAPGMVNKNAVIFPEKIKGKYVVYHRIYPNVLVDYVDDLKFDTYLQGHHFIPPRKKFWDSKKIGAGAPPIKTEDGWLFVYQSVGRQDPGKYKIGAMLVDLENPSKVIARTHTPIVEPVERYENEGFKAGVVYPCGAVVLNNMLHVYYGGADTVVCAASADLPTFLKEMKHKKEPKLTRISSPLFN